MSQENPVVKEYLTASKITVPERKRRNRDTAFRLAEAGIPVVGTKNKAPWPRKWNKLDTNLSDAEREASQAKMDAERIAKGETPKAAFYFGSTLDKDVLRKWTTKDELTPSVTLELSGLIVVDLDIKDGVDGVALFHEWAAEHNTDLSQCPKTISQSGGLHYYFSNPDRIGNGKVAERRWDLKGSGGQVVAAGAVRDDGKTYDSASDAPDLIEAFKAGTIPPIPAEIVAEFKAKRASDHATPETDIAPFMLRLRNQTWPNFDEIVGDDTLAKFDFDVLSAKDSEFRDAR